VNESSINARREEQNYEWIVPVDYGSNLDDFSDSFILNKSQSKLFYFLIGQLSFLGMVSPGNPY